MTFVALVGTIAGTVLASTLLTGMVRRYTLARAILDVPNERSSHEAPTPRGGGLVIAFAWLIVWPVLRHFGLVGEYVFVGIWGAGVLVAFVAWQDDRRGVSVRSRLALQFVAAAWTLYWLGGFESLELGATRLHFGVVGYVLAILTVVWMVNLYNFMDGIDGLAGAQAVVASAVMGAILWSAGARGLAAAIAVLGAASAGFLVWNVSPAKIFMGDVGSSLLGFAFASVAIAGETTEQVPALVLLIPLGVFIYDATVTLAERALRGERVYAAHRDHAYQLLVRSGWSHLKVTAASACLMSLLGAAAWWVSGAQNRLVVGLVAAGVSLAIARALAVRRATRRLEGRDGSIELLSQR